ncbi:MAG: amidohydrolase [Clostridia bacterium]|nr:amidohydrolase [Clostridia bacterium]
MRRLFTNCDILAWRDDQFHTIRNGFLGVDGDTICYVGEQRPAEAYDEERDMSGRLLMPGLINCHCHAAMTLLRGVGSDLPLDKWLFEEMIPVEDRLTAEDIAAGNELAMMEMIASGITSFSDMYMEAHTAIQSNETIGMKMNVCRVIQSFDPNEKAEDSPRIPESIALFEQYHGAQNGRVHIDFAVHAEYTSTDAVIKGYADRCRPYIERGAQMQIHLSETQKEHNECIQRHGMTPAAWCEAMGLFDVPTGAAHCVWVTPEDMEILRRKRVSPIHNPTSNMKLGSGFAPVPQMLDMGLNVTLGTDGAASNNNLNMFEEMHLAAIIHNGYHRDAVIMKPEQVLRMATVNGAKLQGRDDTGRLAVGMKADVIAIDFRDKAHLYPAFDPMTMVVYAAQASDVCMTMVDGRILYEDGNFLTLDKQQVLKNAAAAVQRLYGEAK